MTTHPSHCCIAINLGMKWTTEKKRADTEITCYTWFKLRQDAEAPFPHFFSKCFGEHVSYVHINTFTMVTLIQT